jgi:hypothetical protein
VSSSITGSSAFDFDADGASEVVYSDEHDVWVWSGASGALIYRGEGHASGTHLEYPVVAQVIDDGPPQIVVGSNNLSSPGWNGITLLSDSGRAWVPTRSVWNQHAFMPTHIEDDLSIPAVPDHPWQVGQGFRQNEVTTTPGLAAPDLAIELHAVCYVDCPEVISLQVRPVNHGVQAGSFEITLSRSDDGTVLDSASLLTLAGGTVGEPMELSFDALLDGDVPLVMTIDAGNAVQECDEANNTLSILAPGCP